MNMKQDRQHYVDWLRVVATVGIFLFHNSRVYNYGDWSIKNAQTTLGATQFVEFMDMWMMPMFFILSGASVYFSLRSRNGSGFLKERFLRIMVPWLVIGIFVMAPPQVYLERVSHGEFTGSFVQFIPHYFDGLYGFGGNFAFHGMHLWYLMQLSVFSVILLPLLLPRSRTGISPAQSIAARLNKSWMLALLFVPVGSSAQQTPGARVHGGHGKLGHPLVRHVLHTRLCLVRQRKSPGNDQETRRLVFVGCGGVFRGAFDPQVWYQAVILR